MEEPYTTFDTFTVSENFAPGEDPLAPVPKVPILARLPRLAVADQKSNRFDDPEKGLIGVHEPTTSAPAKAPAFGRNDNPAATIRFDTVLTDDGFVEADRKETDHPVAAREQAISMLKAPITEKHESPALYPIAEFDSWLLNLEATVMPYSRWIALAAVIAALGLTMILLRGSAPVTLGDAPVPGNQVNHLTSDETLAVANEMASTPAPSAADLSTEEGLQPLESSPGIITNAFATTATGPSGHEPASRARLAQRIQPVEPFRVRTETERTEVAMQPPSVGYPRTATSGPLTPMTSQGSTLR